MNNKNYVKLKYPENKPEKSGWYDTNIGIEYFNADSKTFNTVKASRKLSNSINAISHIVYFYEEHPLTDTDQNQERKEVDYESIIDRMCPKGDWTDEMVHAALEAAVTEYKRLNNI